MAKLPEKLEKRIEALLKDKLQCRQVAKVRHLSQGSWTNFYQAQTDQGNFFIKSASASWLFHFEAEAKELQTLDNMATVRVPKSYYYGDEGDAAFLVLEYLNLAPHTVASQKILGKELAKMHQTRVPWQFGFDFDTTIGATKQLNPWSKDWVDFFKTYRLGYQLSLVQDSELRQQGERLCDHLDIFFAGVSIIPSLLHGDLWAGNTASDEKGWPVVYDPACYYGHHEAELSIMKMFGGFSSEFFEEYHSYIPKQTGFEERQKCYQLYHYLNHYHLFGDSYRASCLHLIQGLNAITAK